MMCVSTFKSGHILLLFLGGDALNSSHKIVDVARRTVARLERRRLTQQTSQSVKYPSLRRTQIHQHVSKASSILSFCTSSTIRTNRRLLRPYGGPGRSKFSQSTRVSPNGTRLEPFFGARRATSRKPAQRRSPVVNSATIQETT